MTIKKSIRLGSKRWILSGLTLVALLLSVELMWLANPGQLKIVTRFNNLLYDARFTVLTPQREAQVPIVIVDLDEASIQQEGRWPWDRKKVAHLITELQASQVGLIGLDIVFSEPSRNALQQVLQQAQLSAATKADLENLKDNFDSDLALVKALGANTVPGYFFQNGTSSARQLPFPFYQLSAEQQTNNRLLRMNSYTGSLPV
ncbi:MAG TPA: CHASE2 domain-containing protein, partial [Pseudomonadales bacterium]|nr:CHASE2 domain-containing protein [Pseudomonadales bacterium]